MPYAKAKEWEIYISYYPASKKPYFVKFFKNGVIEDSKYYLNMKGVESALKRRFGTDMTILDSET